MPARRTASTGRTTSLVGCLSALGPGFTVADSTVEAITVEAITGVRDTATGAATVAGRGTEIAQGTRIEALQAAAMPGAGSAATRAVVSTAVMVSAATVEADSRVVAAFTVTVEADSMVAEAPTLEAVFMEVAGVTEAGTANLI